MIAWSSDAMLAHDPGPHHPESPARLDAARRGLDGLVTWREAPSVARDDLVRVHDVAYIDKILDLRGTRAVLDPDTFLVPGSVHAAELAAGGAVAAVDALIDGETRVAWSIGRPPGHHAGPARSAGFCVFNNVAVAAARALSRGLSRVCIVDWDLHHGDGTQVIFEARDDVLFYSSHQHGGGFYPGTGAGTERGVGPGEGYTINAPLAPGAGDAAIEAALVERFLPVAEAFRPELVLVSAGFDAHARDPLGGLRVSEAGFAALAGHLASLARAHAHGRIGLVLEGGYDLWAIERSVAAVANALAPLEAS